jgi:adenylate cyclase
MLARSKRRRRAPGRLLGRTPIGIATRLLDLRGPHRTLLERFAQRGSITILFSDIVDFTEATDVGGERAALALLDAHDRVVIPAVRRHRGRVVKSVGDGVMAAFSDPADAVRAATAILARAAERDARSPRLRLRLGLDAGRATRRGDDYIGQTVNVAARLVKRARPGEALVTDAVRRAAGDWDGAVWRQGGRPTLKGVQRPPRTWRLRPAPTARARRRAPAAPRLPSRPAAAGRRTGRSGSGARR